MDAEKKRSKGKLHYLFDWHAKPRKKLFPSSSHSSAGSNEGKESIDDSTVSESLSRETRFGEDGYLTKGSSSNTCTSSVNGDDAYGTRAPSVVARLMGLESLPTSGEASSISSLDYETTTGNSKDPRNVSANPHDHHPADYSYTVNRLEGYNWKSDMMRGRPIERFQTEVLPPKSAKPISITHHKLLSPVKSPGFVPTNDAAYIMEAAARIIDSAPQASLLTRTPSFGSVSSPRMRDIRDKMEAAHRSNILSDSSKKSKQSPSAKPLRRNLRDKLFDTSLSRSRTSDSETRGLRNTRKKVKDVSPAAQEKDSLQKKDGTTSSNSKSLVRKEHKQVKPKQSSNSQSTAKKSTQTRNSANRSSEGLTLNTEKQNCLTNKDKANSVSSIPNQQRRRSVQASGSVGSSKVQNTIMLNSENSSKKVISTFGNKTHPSLSRMKNISRNKEPVIKDEQSKGANADNLLAKRNDISLQEDSAMQSGTDKKEVMDVISFTFNSPLKKSAGISHSYNEMTESNSLADYESYKNEQSTSKTSSSALRLKLNGADTLSFLLEQKLKELTDRDEFTRPKSDSVMEYTDRCAVPIWSESVSKRSAVRAIPVEQDWQEHNPDFTYDEPKREDIEGDCINIKTNQFVGKERLDGHPDILVPECSVSHGSCISSNNKSDYTYGNAESFLSQSDEEFSCASTEKFNAVVDERDVSDTASSSYYEEWDGRHTSTSHSVSEFYLTYWELQYVRQIVHCGKLKELVLDTNTNFIDPCVFDQVENLMINSTMSTEECTKLARGLLFDCVNDCLCLRYEKISYGSYNAWCRWRVLLQNEDWLVEDLFNEIIGLENMGNLVVDELVEKEMNTQYRGWLDFEIEMLEEGMDIERDIEESLIDDLIYDIFLS